MIFEMRIAYLLHVPHLYFPCLMDPYTVNMMPGMSVVAHISLLQASMIAYAYDPFLKFHNMTVRACRLL